MAAERQVSPALQTRMVFAAAEAAIADGEAALAKGRRALAVGDLDLAWEIHAECEAIRELVGSLLGRVMGQTRV